MYCPVYSSSSYFYEECCPGLGFDCSDCRLTCEHSDERSDEYEKND